MSTELKQSDDSQSQPPSASDLPVSVVSADVIEQLAPYVPQRDSDDQSDYIRMDSADDLNHPLSARKAVTRSLPGATSHQVLLTSLPLIFGDAFSLLCSTFAAALVTMVAIGGSLPVTLPNQMIAVVLCYLLIGAFHGLFPGTGTSPVVELRQSVLSVWASFCLMIILNLAFGDLVASEIILAVVGLMFASVMVPLFRMQFRKWLAKTSWWGERMIIIGAGPQGRALFQYYDRVPDRGLRPIGVVDIATVAEMGGQDELQGLTYLGSVNDFNRIFHRYQPRWAIVAPKGSEQPDMGKVLAQAGQVPNLLILPTEFLLPSLWASTRECAGMMGVHLRDHLQNPFARFTKRLTDLVLASLALVALLPLLILIMIWIKLRSPGACFYGHTRIGYGGKPFQAWKLRTMVQNADKILDDYLAECPEACDEWLRDQKLKDDPRIIKGIGHFLRKTSLDELPQLWNVIKGEMSLVGPRPIVTAEVDKYREMFPLYLRVRPGITGLWQVSGRNDTSYEQRVRLDSYYVCNWSPWLDAYLILRTVRTIFMREGAY